MATHSSILAWGIHGQRRLAGYSPQGHRQSDTTEATEQAQAKSFRLPLPQFSSPAKSLAAQSSRDVATATCPGEAHMFAGLPI